jgi:N-acetylglucosaminyldiphosphoundecaprenol N-acetyl-beta-D-mannosaminyltransferase
VSALDVDEVCFIVAAATRRDGGYVTVCNVHSLVTARSDSEHLRALLESIANVADGMPLVWAARMLGRPTVRQVRGLTLFERLLSGDDFGVTRHFLIGGTPETQHLLSETVRARFPMAAIVGRWIPNFTPGVPSLPDSIRNDIVNARPDVIWVGLGCPRQEKWMLRHWRFLAPAVLIGVGAAFDFLAGTKRTAPIWMQRLGAEWLFRLLTEPRRLAWRYFRTNPAFLWRIAAQIVRERLVVVRRR